MLKVGVDIDGVLANFTASARTLCKELFNGRPDDSLIQTTWAFESLGITKEEESLLWRKIDSIPNWWMTLKPEMDAWLINNLCHDSNYRVVFITNRKNGTGLGVDIQSAYWLEDNFELSHANVVISDDKGPVAKGLGLDYYIDDRPKNVSEVAAAAPNCKTFLKKATYSTTFDYPNRISSFNEFAKIILET